jgi:hypothetical protein
MPDDEKTPEMPWTKLGFETFAEYEADRAAKIAAAREEKAKAEARLEEKDTFINRQADELGQLRKEKGTPAPKEDKIEDNKQDNGDTTDDKGGETSESGDELDGMNVGQLTELISEDEQKELDDHYKTLSPDQQQLVTGSPEGQAAYLRQFIKAKDTVPDSFFSAIGPKGPKRVQQSVSDKVKGLFKTEAAKKPSPADVQVLGIPESQRGLAERQLAQRQRGLESGVGAGGDVIGNLRRMKQEAT